MATAASIRVLPCALASRKFSAPFLCICQCIPVVWASYFWSRYMPTFRLSVVGFFVKTSGSVINGPPSPGQQVKIGNSSRDGLSLIITSWQGALLTYFGKQSAFRAIGINETRSILWEKEIYGSRKRLRISSATSSTFSTPSAIAMRSIVPKAFISTGTL